MIGDIAANVLADVITATGGRIGGAIIGSGDGRFRDDLEMASWFNTYRLTETPPDIAIPPAIPEDALTLFLQGDSCHAILHELLAARLCAAPESDIAHLRMAFQRASDHLGTALPADDLFDYFDGQICDLTGRLAGGLPDSLPRLREGAIAARIVAALHAIERHCAILRAESDPAADADFQARYRRHVIDHHGKIDPPDFERRRRVPIEDLYVAPDLSSIPPGQPTTSGHSGANLRQLTLQDFSAELDRTVLLGAPGAGKTTAANALMHRCASDPKQPLPFLVTLRTVAGQDRSILGHIEHILETFYQCPAPPYLVARLLLNGSALVIFDGLDELIDTSRRTEMTAKVERFATEYPNARILVTSRLVGYDQARLDERQFATYRIGEFDDARVQEYATKWFRQENLPPDEAKRWARAFIEESAAVADLRTNPLLLALMCILYRGERSIPQNRIGVYEECTKLLFRRWDAQRDIHTLLRARPLIEPAIRHLAFWLFTRDNTETAVTERQLLQETAVFLQHRGIETYDEALDAAAEFVDFCRGRAWVFSDAGTKADGTPLYTFTHRTFLEYFAASYLTTSHDTPEKLAQVLVPHLAREEWEVVAELSIQIKERTTDRGAERVVAAILTDRRKRSVTARGNVLNFLARCLDSIDLPPRVVRDLARRIFDHVLLSDLDAREHTAVPLATMLDRCWPCRHIVHEELSARVESMIVSDDPQIRLDALRLAVWCADGNLADAPMAQNGRTGPFWRDISRDYIDRFRAELLAVSAHDLGFRYRMLNIGALSVDDVLAGFEGGLGALFSMSSTGLFVQVKWAPFMLQVVFQSSGFGISSDPVWRDACGALGRFLNQSWPEPPWLPRNAIGWNTVFLTDPVTDQNMSPDELTGAAIAFLVISEAVIKYGHPVEAISSEGTGPMVGVRQYVRRRAGDADAPLPHLNLTPHIQGILEKWALSELNFTSEEG